jgi:hypothetical protein
VQEFNGLVSIKGPAQVGPFTFSRRMYFFLDDVKKLLQKFFMMQLKFFSIKSMLTFLQNIFPHHYQLFFSGN